MPLASWFALHFYGPGTAAMVTDGAGETVAGIKGYARSDSVIDGVGAMPNADATRLKNSPCIIDGAAEMMLALPKARARLGSVINVNELSQDDVTGAVLEAQIESGLSLREALRLITAALAGKVSGAAGTTVTIRDVNDTVDRIVATVDASGNRSAVTLDTSG